ncbi:MAG: GAF domain-containing protein [Chloroflexi bacterium]|nr:GAF domain-containing protein [Chloroflexota bacterium]
MKVVGCLTHLDREWTGLISTLEEIPASVILQGKAAELLKNAGVVMPDLFLVDERAPAADVARLVQGLSPAATLIRVAPSAAASSGDSPLDTRAYDSLFLLDSPAAHRQTLRRALERSELLESAAAGPTRREPPESDQVRPAEPTCELALRYLSRTLSAGFNTDELIQPFLDLVMELAGVARAAVLMRDPVQGHFRVRASRGLYSAMLKNYAHPHSAGLVGWLMAEGRPVRRGDASVARLEDSAEINRSFQALQATVCIPMAAMGELIGVLALGTCINGSLPADDDVGTLFAIGGHVAVAIQNTTLHHEMAHHKAQGESVLEHMTNLIPLDR